MRALIPLLALFAVACADPNDDDWDASVGYEGNDGVVACEGCDG